MDGSYEDHMAKVNMVLERLGSAGLKLDIKKCEFAVKQVKYLGFIITAGEGIKVDPEKGRGHSQVGGAHQCSRSQKFYWIRQLLSRLHRKLRGHRSPSTRIN
jgi:hypothetical protein